MNINMNDFGQQKRKDLAIIYNAKEESFANLFFSICSITGSSDAADFNKYLRVNRFDVRKAKDNESARSEQCFELYFGKSKAVEFLDEKWSQYGMHILMIGKKACLYVDEMHINKEDIKRFNLFAVGIENRYKKIITQKTKGGLMLSSTITTGAINATMKDDYWDLPAFFKKIGVSIRDFLIYCIRKIGFLRQHDIVMRKKEILAKFFYVSYFPEFMKLNDNDK